MPPVLRVASGTVATVNVSETFTGPEKLVLAIVISLQDVVPQSLQASAGTVCRNRVYPVAQIAGDVIILAQIKRPPKRGPF